MIFFYKKINIVVIILLMSQAGWFQLFGQCVPNISLTKSQGTITIDDFSDLINGVTLSSATYLNIDASGGCVWDLFVDWPAAVGFGCATASSLTRQEYSATAGVPLPLDRIFIRAANGCRTADHDYGLGPCGTPFRICGNTFTNPFDGATDNYIVGTSGGVDEFTAGTTCSILGGTIEKNGAPCSDGACNGAAVPPGIIINDDGTFATRPTSHQFRIDLQIIPGVAAEIRPGLYTLDLWFVIQEDAGVGNLNCANFTLTIDVQPILQLKMTSPSQVDFTFNDVKQYQGGIIKYDATILEVNSSLDWDLMAIGTSVSNETGLGAFWDNPVDYSDPALTNGNDQIPLHILELFQVPANPSCPPPCAIGDDYSQALSNPPSGNNNIEVAVSPYNALGNFVAPSIGGKTIAGNWLSPLGPPADAMNFGSYIIINAGWNRVNFRYKITYKITPGLPVMFPDVISGNRVLPYALPGAYTMEVKYLLMEDQ